MKRIVLSLLIAGFVVPVFAGERGMDDRGHYMNPYAAETEAILADLQDRTPASLTFGELGELSAALSVPAQKSAYVRGSAMASAMIPGLGQIRNGDPLSGALFMLGDFVISAGTAVGLYFLLPSELRFDQLDYLNTPVSDIHAAWQTAHDNATFAEMLPFMGVATGGMILKHALSYFSAKHAARLAVTRIESGAITFEPRIGGMHGPHGMMSLGFGLKY